MKPKTPRTSFVHSTILSIAISLSAQGATITKSASGTDLTAGASWGGTAPGAADTATWTTGSLGAGLTLDSPAAWQGITVSGAISAIGISGSGTLTLGTGGMDLAVSAVDLSLANAITLNGNQTWKAANGRTLAVSGSVGGAGNLTTGAAAPTSTYNAGYISTSSGSPTIVFPNTNLTGILGVNGVMQGGWIPTATPAAGYFFTNNGTTATVQLQFYDGTSYTKVVKLQLSQSGADVVAYQLYAKYKGGNYLGQDFDSLAVDGQPPMGSGGYGVNSLTATTGGPANGTVSLSGTNAYAGATNVNFGTLSLAGGSAIPDASAVTVASGATLLLNGSETIGSLAGAGSANLGSNNLTTGADNTSTTFSGTLSGTGGVLTKTGTGTLTLSGASTHTGGGSISQGTVIVTSNNGLGSAGTVTMNDAGTGSANTSLFAQHPTTGDLVFSRPITVANQGTGTVTIGSNRVAPTTTARTFFDGLITINRDLTLSASLTDRVHYRGGITGTGNVTIAGGQRTIFSETTSTPFDGEGTAPYDFAGNLTLTGTGTSLQFNSNIDLTNVPTVTVGAGTILNGAYGKTVGINSLSGSGTIGNAGGTAGTVTIKVGIGNGSGTFSGVIQNNQAPLTLQKTGSGVQTLTGACTYTGATTINGGTLKLGTGGSINNSASITVAPGATFDAADTGFTLGAGKTLTAGDSAAGDDIVGPITSSGTIRPAGTGVLGTIKGITNLTLGGTLEWERSANSTASDGIVINGTLTISAGFTLNPATVGFPSAGTRSYAVVSGITTPLTQADIDNLPVLPADYTWDTSDATALKITHVQAGANLAWTGAADGNWDTATANWSGTPGIYQDGDFCTFDDSATGTTIIDIPSDVTPGAILFNHSALNYTVGSANSLGIAGSITLVKEGSGTLKLTSNNIYTGGTTLTGGVLSFGQGAIPAAGGLAMNGGTLRWETGNVQNISAVIDMVNGKTATFDTNGNDVSFTTGLGDGTTGSLVKTGAGSLTLAGTGTWTGTTEVAGGSLRAGTNGAFGSSPVVVGNGSADASVIIANRADIANPITVSASGAGMVTIGADNSGSGIDAASVGGTLTLNRSTTLSSQVASDRLAINGKVTGPVGTLTVTGGSRTTLSSTLNDFTGNIIVTGAGTVLQASVASDAGVIPDACNITIDASAVFQTASYSGTETIGGLNGSGEVRSFKDIYPTNTFGTTLTIGGANQSGDFSGIIANGNAPLTITKTGTGKQVLRGVNTYTGNTVVNAGELELATNAALTFRVTNTTHNTLTGAGTVTLNGNFAIDVSAVTATSGSWQLENAASLTGAYGSTFKVVTPGGADWSDAGANLWKYSSGTVEFTFDETNGTLTAALAGYSSWIAKAEYGLAPADQDPADDPDNDGVNNLVEYALDGRNPSVSDGPVGSFVGNTMSFTKRAEAAADPKISYQIQESDDLGLSDTWAEAPAGPDYTNNPTTISYTLPTGKPKTFARLVVQQAN